MRIDTVSATIWNVSMYVKTIVYNCQIKAIKNKSSWYILTTALVFAGRILFWRSLPCCPSPVLPSYHQDQAHTAVGGGSGPAGCGRDAPGPSRGSDDEGTKEAGADSRSSEGSRSPQSTDPATHQGWTKQCCNTQKRKDVRKYILKQIFNQSENFMQV